MKRLHGAAVLINFPITLKIKMDSALVKEIITLVMFCPKYKGFGITLKYIA